VQLPLAAKETVSPDDELALTVKSESPNVLSTGTPNVIDWLALAIENVRTTSPEAL